MTSFAKEPAIIALAALLGTLAGLGVLLTVAALTDQRSLFLLAGFIAFCAVYVAGAMLATRAVAPGSQIRRRAALLGVGVLLVTVIAAAALLPLGDPRLPPAPVVGMQSWDLPTGSRIAYVRIAAEGVGKPTPIIFLHGGPGVPDMAGDAAYFGQLVDDGFDLYLDDQVGRGRSSRLADPRGYTLTRDVADLEAIRRAIGAERMILIGHSYGGMLAAAYAAAEPTRVAKMVLTSPADPAPDPASPSFIGRLDVDQQAATYALLLQPRALLGYALMQVNPRAAHAFAGDAEMDAVFDRVYNRTQRALHCAGKPPGPELHGLGFYAHYTQQSAASPQHADFMAALAGSNMPALIVKGSCDYLSWASATAYGAALPNARFLYLSGAGHNVFQDEPERYMAEVRAFLIGRPMPEPAYEGSQPPADYQGPP